MKDQDFHCPNCGGALNIEDITGTTVKCQYCDSILPVPSWLEENIEPVVLYADNTRYLLLNNGLLTPNEAREMALKECEPVSFIDRFNTIGYKYGVKCLSPNMYLTDCHTSIEETAMGVLVRKDGFKLSKAIRKMFRKK